jgi:nanoRNase/pAp phosphatase (c-di-AMP/oligoRNAs hydrolase)
MTWLRSFNDPKGPAQLIPKLGHQSLASVVQLPVVASTLQGLLQEHKRAIELIRSHIKVVGKVACYDLSDTDMGSHSPFIAYMLCPQASYSVGLVRKGKMANISIGHNPWATTQPTKHIANLCHRYGGGGHPHVGGIAVPLQRAKQVLAELCEELNAET